MSKWLVIGTILALPLYVARFGVFGIPTNVPELLALVSTAAVLIRVFRQQPKPAYCIQHTTYSKERVSSIWYLVSGKLRRNWTVALGLTALIVGLLTSAAFNHVWREGLGALKSWIVVPALFALATSASIKYQVSSIKHGSVLQPTHYNLQPKHIWLAIVGFGAWLSAVALGYVLLGQFTYDGRLRAFYDSPNELGMFLALTLTATLWVGNCVYGIRYTVYGRAMLCLVVAVQLLALLLTQSQGSMLGAAAGALAVLAQPAIKKLKPTIYNLLTTTLLTVYLLVNVLLTTQLQRFIPSDSRSSLASRAMIWQAAWDIGKDNWLFGIGPRQFQAKYLEYQPKYKPYLEWAAPQPHNLLLAIWLQAGLMGLAGFVLLVGPLLAMPLAATLLVMGITDTPLVGGFLAYFIALTYYRACNDLCYRCE